MESKTFLDITDSWHAGYFERNLSNQIINMFYSIMVRFRIILVVF